MTSFWEGKSRCNARGQPSLRPQQPHQLRVHRPLELLAQARQLREDEPHPVDLLAAGGQFLHRALIDRAGAILAIPGEDESPYTNRR